MKKIKNFSNYYVDKHGTVYRKDKTPIKPFNSCGYYQVYMRDDNDRRRILGVHQVVAMAYLNYYDGCVVHHKDEDKHNNDVSNLVVESVSDHARRHANPERLVNYTKAHGSHNRGAAASEEVRKRRKKASDKKYNKKLKQLGVKRLKDLNISTSSNR